jgi:hypothetical protein
MVESYPQTYQQPEETCKNAEYNHKVGMVCQSCKAMTMPWGTKLPFAVDSSGAIIVRAVRGSILEGLYFRPEDVVAVSLVAFCKGTGTENYAWYEDITPLVNDPVIQKVGVHVFEISNKISKIGAAKSKPKWYEVLADALTEPNLTLSEYESKIIDTSPGEYEALINSTKSKKDDGPEDDNAYGGAGNSGAGSGSAQIERRNLPRGQRNVQNSKLIDYSGKTGGKITKLSRGRTRASALEIDGGVDSDTSVTGDEPVVRKLAPAFGDEDDDRKTHLRGGHGETGLT